jgi:hypothetical protein
LVGNIHITCRSDFRRFVRLLRGGRPRETDQEKKADCKTPFHDFILHVCLRLILVNRRLAILADERNFSHCRLTGHIKYYLSGLRVYQHLAHSPGKMVRGQESKKSQNDEEQQGGDEQQR